MGKLVRAITSDGAVLATALDATDLVARAQQIHQSSATVSAAMGRLITAASMMGAALKNDTDSLTLRVSGGGAAGSLIAVSDAKGFARVTAGNPQADLPPKTPGKLDVGGVVGKEGHLAVLRDLGRDGIQTGYSPLVSGEIGEDLSYYFANSEQVPTVCALGVLVDTDLSIAAAGGYLLQLLPGAGEETIDRMEQNLKGIPPVSSMFRDRLTPQAVLQSALKGFSLEILEEREVGYHCDCSRKRVERVLVSLGEKELHDLAWEQEETEVSCHFCEKKYLFSRADLLALLADAKKPAPPQ